MNEPLFRPAAVEAKRHSTSSQPILAALPSTRYGAALSVLFVMGVIAALLFGKIARKETAYGLIEPKTGVTDVYAPYRGTINNLLVREGDAVTAGQTLAVMDASRYSLENGNIDKKQADRLQTQIENLDALLTKLVSDEAIEHERLESQAINLHRQIEVQKSLGAKLELQRTSLSERLNALTALSDEGLLPKQNLWQMEKDLLSVNQQIDQAHKELLLIQNQITTNDAETERTPFRFRQQKQQLLLQREELLRQQIEVASHTEIAITAPAAGTVTAIAIHFADTIGDGERLLSILPTTSKLRARIFIPTRAVGFVRPGLEVRLRLDAFPHQRFGALEAVLFLS